MHEILGYLQGHLVSRYRRKKRERHEKDKGARSTGFKYKIWALVAILGALRFDNARHSGGS
jgi:hypothetical protein